MLIDKEKILKAKEKLGEQNAIIMAEELELDDFDTKNFKACCPYHSENTPSFIYNPKNYTFHCFGCNKNVDIIDVYMQKGLTYVSAVQKLFDLAKIKYSFGELNVKTKRQYKYPKEVICTNKDKVYKYYSLRKISKETLDYADVREDEYGNAVFNYYDTNDVLTMVKYRPTQKIPKGESKMWCQKNADTLPLLFNMNRINTSNPLLICEGESDCLAAIEAGYSNAVSVPLGAGNFHWIEENWDWLEQFDEIIVCSDNDEAGNKMQKEVVFRLGSWRTKFVEIPLYFKKENGKKIPIKDLNEVLYFYGKEKVFDIIVNAKDTPIASLIDFSDVEDLDLSDIDGLYTGIHQLDKELMRMFFGSLTLLTGTPGSGKTSFLYQLICQSLDQNIDTWLYSKELPSYMTRNWINYIMAGSRHIDEYTGKNDSVYYKVRNSAKQKIGEYYRGRLFLYRDDFDNSVEAIEQSMVDSARKNGSKFFILDNLTTINLQENDNNKYEKQTEFVSWLIQFSMKYNVCVILVAHPRKLQDTSSLSKYDIGGSSNMINLAHRSLGLKRVSKSEKQGILKQNGRTIEQPPNPYDVVVSVIKDRLRGREGFELGLHYDIASRRFFTNPQEFSHQYLWDGNVYKDEVPYPVVDTEEEIFGKIKNE